MPPADTLAFETKVTRRIDVVGAVLVRDGKILAAQRGSNSSLGGLWEFPGGKIESGESSKEALARELQEELNCVAEIGERLETTEHDYEFGTVVLTTYFCTLVSGEPELTEHQDIKWLTPSELLQVEWAPADIPAVDKLIDTSL
nr:(deoxy)nucleoside triphosphate pyrophosphohydrolase [Haematomicrobium sanguinis]